MRKYPYIGYHVKTSIGIQVNLCKEDRFDNEALKMANFVNVLCNIRSMDILPLTESVLYDF